MSELTFGFFPMTLFVAQALPHGFVEAGARERQSCQIARQGVGMFEGRGEQLPSYSPGGGLSRKYYYCFLLVQHVKKEKRNWKFT